MWWRTSAVRWLSALIFCGFVQFVAGSAQSSTETDAVQRDVGRGDFVDAEQNASRLLTTAEQTHGVDSAEAELATELLLEARLRNGRAAAPDTLTLAQRLAAARERRFGADHVAVASALSLLGQIHLERGDPDGALPLHERALSIRRQYSEQQPAAVADSLDQLGLTLTLLQRFAPAEKALGEARTIREGQRESAPRALARTSYLLAVLHRYDGRYTLATAALDGALESQRQLLGQEHPDYRSSIQLRGDLYFLQGDATAALRLWSASLSLAERTLRSDHPDIAIALRLVAVAERGFGDLTSARRLLERALPMGEQGLAECHPERSAIAIDLASVAVDEGDFAAARTLYRSALATRERCLGPLNQRTATVLHNLALLSAKAGDLADADRLHRRAAQMWSDGLGPQHPYVARAWDAIADVAAQRGRFREARTLYERALTIRTRTLGREHPDVAWTLANIAQVLGTSGQPTLALGRIHEAASIYQRVGPGDEPDHMARTLALRGTLEQQRGDLKAARVSFAEALSLRERIFGTGHPLTAESRAAVAASDFLLGGTSDAALAAALEAEQVGRDHLRYTVRSLPERQSLAYAARRPRGLDLAISILTNTRDGDVRRVFDAVVRSRSVVLEELAARSNVLSGSDPALATLTTRVTATRARFANLILRSLIGEEVVPRAVLDEVRRDKEELERELAELSGFARSEADRADVGLEEVRGALPHDAALISYVRYDRTSLTTGRGGGRPVSVPSYAAFVVSSSNPNGAMVSIGTVAAVDALVSAWRAQTSGAHLGTADALEAERQVRAAGIRLRQRIWDPIAAQLGGASRVFIVPDGALNLVSFSALPVEGWRYLVERGPVVHLVTAERDLLPSDTGPPGRGLLAVGGAAYGRPPQAAAQTSLQPGCGPDAFRFDDLPGTRGEVQEIARLWAPGPYGAESSRRDEVTVLSGAAATESAVITGFAGKRVIHLATHGFFLGGPCGPAAASLTRSVGGLVVAGRRDITVEDNPLLASGLVFAGVNQRSTRSARGDGILTAEEVASLNMRGTEWAVLSACDTGLGEIRAGEGVLGLRRAFQIAGVRTVIMSLWAVGDETARTWMRALYEERFQRGASTAEAVNRASVRTLQARRASGQSTHPFYWAAFVAAGDWN